MSIHYSLVAVCNPLNTANFVKPDETQTNCNFICLTSISWFLWFHHVIYNSHSDEKKQITSVKKNAYYQRFKRKFVKLAYYRASTLIPIAKFKLFATSSNWQFSKIDGWALHRCHCPNGIFVKKKFATHSTNFFSCRSKMNRVLFHSMKIVYFLINQIRQNNCILGYLLSIYFNHGSFSINIMKKI
jgi:hypothetical protein